MEHQFIMGRSMKELGANPDPTMQDLMNLLGGADISQVLGLGVSMPLTVAYDALPDPPVSPVARLAFASARRPLPTASTASAASPTRSCATSSPASPPRTLRAPARSPRAGAASGAPRPSSSPTRRPRRPWPRRRAFLPRTRGPFRCVHITRAHVASHQAEIERWLKLLAAKSVHELAFINCPLPCSSAAAPPSPASTSAPRKSRRPRHEVSAALRRLPPPPGPHASMIVIKDQDLNFLNLTIISTQTRLRLRLVSRNLRCVQLGMCRLDDVAVVDASCLERLLLWTIVSSDKCPKIKIVHAPNLRVLGYWQQGDLQLEIGSRHPDPVSTPYPVYSCQQYFVILISFSFGWFAHCALQASTRASPSTIIPTVRMLALEVQFEVRDDVKMMPCFLKCFPNIETIHVHSLNADKPTGQLNLNFWQEAGQIECVQRHVKRFVIHEFRGNKSEIAFLKFIAERAQTPEKMVVMVASQCFTTAEDVKAKLKPLTSAEWASKGIRLTIFKSPSSDGASPPWNFQMASDFSLSDPFDFLTADAELMSTLRLKTL
ncbi:hypothetical protein EJB05_08368, partial [Eragrostis curvula]